ncbi:haloacid dehalogenase type II [Acidisphaera sp. L21]|uniref:haloacid dehalogenase type II n=1 Tax=Acidisphaera sp. L21 TaxID=1641851 RepID=UPI0020B16F7D|nr:haloacid dehalogenase type II [Acidisphaera sp. L21]
MSLTESRPTGATTMRLTDFTALTFDCYGTLIDWEGGIYTALQPLLQAANVTQSRDAVLELFATHESDQEEQTPGMLYPDILAQVHRRLASAFGADMPEDAHLRFGASVPDWPAFADSASSLQYLKKYYQLVILSNVDRQSFAGSNKRLAVEFDAIYTAQDVGSYKPNPANFEYMLAKMADRGVQKSSILHTAQSLFHDHAPAKTFGMASAWIDRRHDQGGWGATVPAPGSRYDFRFTSLADMVKAHQEDLRA